MCRGDIYVRSDVLFILLHLVFYNVTDGAGIKSSNITIDVVYSQECYDVLVVSAKDLLT